VLLRWKVPDCQGACHVRHQRPHSGLHLGGAYYNSSIIRQLQLTFAIAFNLAAPICAQTLATPDISGTWVLDMAKSKPAKKVVPDAETVVIKCAGASIEMAFFSGGDQSLEMFVVDGKEHTQETGGGGQLYSKAQWKKSVLFTEIGARVTSQGIGTYDFLTAKERWTLSADGHILTREFEDPKQIFVYDKQ
jgi:hypothetical protein